MLLLTAWGCGEDGLKEGGNHPPNISVLAVVPENPEPNSIAQVRYQVVDVDGDPVTVRFEATAGRVVQDAEGVRWETPPETGTFRITCIASDGKDLHRRSLDVLVWQPAPGDYYPLAIGNEWVFQDERGNTVTMRIVDRIAIEHTDRSAFVLETRTSDPEVPEGVANYAYVNRYRDPETGTEWVEQYAVNAVFGSADTILFQPWLPLYRFPLIPGKSWNVQFEALTTDGFPVGGGTAEYAVLEETALETPAGRFEHVMLVEERFTWEIFGQHIDTTVSRKWLAPGVGIVQLDQTQARGAQEPEHIIARLQRYSVRSGATAAPFR